MTITEFLTERYDEDEAVARAALGSPRRNGKTHARRVLADVAAKRAIVALFLEVQEYVRLAPEGKEMADGARVSRETLSQVLLALVQPYAEHADFDEGWKL